MTQAHITYHSSYRYDPSWPPMFLLAGQPECQAWRSLSGPDELTLIFCCSYPLQATKKYIHLCLGYLSNMGGNRSALLFY